ncbi:uncharacterized protein LOC107264554 [Cephus cinctus]|uniref:Uncharacterized protein LOC107264554 n=1 Tax=Cephus cinctus TaxID=211228 RepID=A0AAJ7FEX2_CEPCN|nr:uncharacterized protein LOC107264554 [Cephus cinctus]
MDVTFQSPFYFSNFQPSTNVISSPLEDNGSLNSEHPMPKTDTSTVRFNLEAVGNPGARKEPGRPPRDSLNVARKTDRSRGYEVRGSPDRADETDETDETDGQWQRRDAGRVIGYPLSGKADAHNKYLFSFRFVVKIIRLVT